MWPGCRTQVMDDHFTDETVIVTGSSRGIGRRVATRFADAGANVVTNSRRNADAQSVASEIRQDGGTAIGVEADVTDRDSVGTLVETAVDEFGRLDVLVNNAGVNRRGPAENLSPEDWQHTLDVNLTGTWNGCQAAAQQFFAQDDGGRIVNLASIMGQAGLPERAPYSASKGGVCNLTRVLAAEWGDRDVRVNALAPGYVETEMVDDAMAEADFDREDIQRRTPLGRFATLDEMATCVQFLSRDDTYVTGEVVTADGGWMADAWRG